MFHVAEIISKNIWGYLFKITSLNIILTSYFKNTGHGNKTKRFP